MRRAITPPAGTLLLLGLALAGCSRQEEPPKTSTSSGASTTVGVISLQRKSLRRVIEQPGTIQAHEQTDLFARVPGYVKKVHVDIGQRVHGPSKDDRDQQVPGKLLAEIAVPELTKEADQKSALVEQAKAEVLQAEKAALAAEANIAIATSSLEETRALQDRWESESQRVNKLVEKGTLDAQARDEVQNQLRAAGSRFLSAKASVVKAGADRDKALADVAAARARVKVAEAEASRLKAIIEYAEVRAPYDGIITARKVNTGDSVQPAGGKGEILFTIARLDPVRVVIYIPEADAELVQEKSAASEGDKAKEPGGTRVHLSLPALRDADITGTIERTSWALNPGTRTLRAELDLPNKKGLFRPGMYLHARIVNDGPESWVLPHSALVKHGAGMACYQIEEGKTVRLEVLVGRGDEQFTEVLKWRKSSASPWQEFSGKEVIAVRAMGLADGQAVNVDSGK